MPGGADVIGVGSIEGCGVCGGVCGVSLRTLWGTL